MDAVFGKQKTHKQKNTTYETQVPLKNMALITTLKGILEDPSKTVRLKRFSENTPIQHVIFFRGRAFSFFSRGHFFLQTTIALRDFHAFKKKAPPRFSKKNALPLFFKRIVSVEPVTENVVFVGCQRLPQKGGMSMFYPCANSGHKITHQK